MYHIGSVTVHTQNELLKHSGCSPELSNRDAMCFHRGGKLVLKCYLDDLWHIKSHVLQNVVLVELPYSPKFHCCQTTEQVSTSSIPDMSGSNSGRCTAYSDRGFHNFCQHFQENIRTASKWSLSFPSESFPFLPPCSEVLVKRKDAHLVNKFLAFNGTRSYIGNKL
jgi:hypothetical protein